MAQTKVLKIRLSLKGRPLKTYRFTKDKVVIGRSPDSDVFLDNPGVSRTHVVLERLPTGYYRLEDQGSANGTFVNDEQARSEILMADDVVRIGKFSLWIKYEQDQRDDRAQAKAQVSPQTYQGTTVLSSTELETLLEEARASDRQAARLREPESADSPAEPAGHPERSLRGILVGVGLTAFVVGSAAGAYVTWLLSH